MFASLEFIQGHSLSQIPHGTVVVVDLWASHCSPCVESVPILSLLQARFPRAIVLGITTETPEQAKPFVADMGSKMSYRVACDKDSACITRLLGSQKKFVLPVTVFINGAGNIVWQGSPTDEALEDLLEACEAEPVGPRIQRAKPPGRPLSSSSPQQRSKNGRTGDSSGSGGFFKSVSESVNKLGEDLGAVTRGEDPHENERNQRQIERQEREERRREEERRKGMRSRGVEKDAGQVIGRVSVRGASPAPLKRPAPLQGTLWKKSRVGLVSWKERHFVQSEEFLYYFGYIGESRPRSKISLKTIKEVSKRQHHEMGPCIGVLTPERFYLFSPGKSAGVAKLKDWFDGFVAWQQWFDRHPHDRPEEHPEIRFVEPKKGLTTMDTIQASWLKGTKSVVRAIGGGDIAESEDSDDDERERKKEERRQQRLEREESKRVDQEQRSEERKAREATAQQEQADRQRREKEREIASPASPQEDGRDEAAEPWKSDNPTPWLKELARAETSVIEEKPSQSLAESRPAQGRKQSKPAPTTEPAREYFELPEEMVEQPVHVAVADARREREAEQRTIEARMTRNPELDLSMMGLTELPREWLVAMKSLRFIDVSFNHFERFPAEALQQHSNNCQYLIMGGCQMRALPSSIGRFTQLRELSLNGNQLQSIPSEIGSCQMLEKLSLANNQISSLPNSIGWLYRLEELHLGGNELSELPATVGNMRKLQLLDVSSCQLRAVPDELVYCTQLMELNLGQNQIDKLPERIGWLQRLAILNVSTNKLRDLPISAGLLEGCTEVGLGISIAQNPIQDRDMVKESGVGSDRLFNYLERRMMMVNFNQRAVMQGYPTTWPFVEMSRLRGASEPAGPKARPGTTTIKPRSATTMSISTMVPSSAQASGKASVPSSSPPAKSKLELVRVAVETIIVRDILPEVNSIRDQLLSSKTDTKTMNTLGRRVMKLKPDVQALVSVCGLNFKLPKPILKESDDAVKKLRLTLLYALKELETTLEGTKKGLGQADAVLMTEIAKSIRVMKVNITPLK